MLKWAKQNSDSNSFECEVVTIDNPILIAFLSIIIFQQWRQSWPAKLKHYNETSDVA